VNLNRCTEKAQEALVQAQELAGEYNHSQIEPEHLLLALLKQADGVVPQIVSKLGIAPQALQRELKEELQQRPKVELELTEAARRRLAEEGYDPVYGARPLKRVMQRRIQDPFALRLLQGEFKDGDKITVDVRDGEYVFAHAAPEAVSAGTGEQR